jgi:hypothetical protein
MMMTTMTMTIVVETWNSRPLRKSWCNYIAVFTLQ